MANFNRTGKVLFNFIGCPQSGKTTTAAMAFAALKEFGFLAEFVPEQARYYIARYRMSNGLPPGEPIHLTNYDQVEIMAIQTEIDEMMVSSGGPGVMVISDASPLNALLYMDPDFRQHPKVKELIARALKLVGHSFYMKPVYDPRHYADPHRVHTYDQAMKIDAKIPELLKELAPDLHVTTVDGTMQSRLYTVQQEILRVDGTRWNQPNNGADQGSKP